MNRQNLSEYILNQYGCKPENPWMEYPNFEIFRHIDNKKWFALIMNIPRSKLGLSGVETIDVVNFKCDSMLIGSLRADTGIFPAYHMNKDTWITVALDGSVSDEKITALLDMSFNLTSSKVKKQK